jgi:hypothetical protein
MKPFAVSRVYELLRRFRTPHSKHQGDFSVPDHRMTDGIAAHSRNLINVAFAFILIGQFLIFSNCILLIYVLAGFWLFHRRDGFASIQSCSPALAFHISVEASSSSRG